MEHFAFLIKKKKTIPMLQPVLCSRIDLLRFRFRLCKSFGSGSFRRIQTIFSSFQTTKFFFKILPFQCQKQHYFLDSWPLIFDFLTFSYNICWIRIQIRFRNRIRNRNAFRFRFRQGKNLRILRFRPRLQVHNTGYNTVKN